MPYKHANGCTCMTFSEFLNEEGKREKKTGGEVFCEIIEKMKDEDEKQEKFWKENPDEILKCLLKDHKEILEDNPDDPIPVQILKVVSAKCSTGFKKSHTEVVIHVLCKDKKIREAKYWHTDWSGSFYDPPETDFDVEWIKIID